MWAQSGSALRRSPCRRPLPAYSVASSTRSVSVAGNGQRSPAAAARCNVSPTVLRAKLSDRAICRSLAPPCFRRRISRTRRIDTLSAGIGPPLVVPDEQSAVHRPAVKHLPPPTRVADFRSEGPGSDRNQWPTSFRNRRPTSPGIRTEYMQCAAFIIFIEYTVVRTKPYRFSERPSIWLRVLDLALSATEQQINSVGQLASRSAATRSIRRHQ